MEILYPILAFIFGAVLAYFIVKSSSISRKIYDELQQNFSQKEAEFNKILAEISAENKSQNQKIAEQQELNFKQNTEIRKGSHPFSNRNSKPTQNRIGKNFC